VATCRYCRSENAPGAIRCAHCTSWLDEERRPVREWYRARQGRWLGGVSRGLANHFRIPVAAVRLGFLLSVLFGGWGVVAYVALWIAMPLEPMAPLPSVQQPAPSAPPG
jgi:phage shock protein PspC (stress-responsive transcriptional regulator)